MQETKEDLTEIEVEEEDNFFVTDATILDTLQGIAKHLMTNGMNKEEMYLYVSYVITLDT